MWLAISYSRGSSWPRDWTHISCISYIGRWILFHSATWEALKKKPYTHLLNWICGWSNSYIAFIKAPYEEFIKYIFKNNADILQTLSYRSRVEILPKLFHKTNLTLKSDLDKNTIYKENCRQISTVSIDMECRTSSIKLNPTIQKHIKLLWSNGFYFSNAKLVQYMEINWCNSYNTLKKKNVIYAIRHSTEEQRLHIVFRWF